MIKIIKNVITSYIIITLNVILVLMASTQFHNIYNNIKVLDFYNLGLKSLIMISLKISTLMILLSVMIYCISQIIIYMVKPFATLYILSLHNHNTIIQENSDSEESED